MLTPNLRAVSLNMTKGITGMATSVPQIGTVSETELALSNLGEFRRHLLECPRMFRAPVPEEDAITSAWRFWERVRGRVTVAAVVRSAEGGVTVCFINGDHYADCEFFNDGDALSIISNGRGDATVFDVDLLSEESVGDAITRISECIQSCGETVPTPTGGRQCF